jgi:hypothetical protein
LSTELVGCEDYTLKIISLFDIGNIKADMGVYIEEVATSDKDELMYLAAGIAYNHYHFRILAIF